MRSTVPKFSKVQLHHMLQSCSVRFGQRLEIRIRDHRLQVQEKGLHVADRAACGLKISIGNGLISASSYPNHAVMQAGAGARARSATSILEARADNEKPWPLNQPTQVTGR